MEYIGKIQLDTSHYSGEDLYCDGIVEDELLSIVSAKTKEEITSVIESRADWPTFYHLSPQRQNIIEWLPMNGMTKVLEVGSGCGAITGMLAEKAGIVHGVDLSLKRSRINAHRHKEYDNVTIHVGNFKDIEPDLPSDYDYVLLIGVFEYARGYMGGETPYVDFMNILKKHLKPEGRIVIAIENQFGLKYWAGCREDHLGTYFSGLEGYEEEGVVRTFTRRGLERILSDSCITEYQFYYPYPDYKFMTTMYSDNHLPQVGELTTSICNYDRERMLLFDESLVYDTIIEEEQFPLYSNSYMVVIGPQIPIWYSRYSNERKPQYRIRTDIGVNDDGERVVTKQALTSEAYAHIGGMGEIYKRLKARYAGSGITPNRIVKSTESCIQLEYVEGETLESKFDTYLKQGDIEAFVQLFKEYVEAISYHASEHIITNLDFIFSNVIVQGKVWTLIDYEWAVQEAIDPRMIAYRAFYCYTLGAKHRQDVVDKEIRSYLGMTKEEIEQIHKEEVNFQHDIAGDTLVKAQMCQLIDNPVRTMEDGTIMQHETIRKIQIYEDHGKGFSEEDSYLWKDSSVGKNTVTVQLQESINVLRIDPCMQSCVVTLLEITLNGIEDHKLLGKIRTNGVNVGTNCYYFSTNDPNLTIPLKGIKNRKCVQLELTYELSYVIEGV